MICHNFKLGKNWATKSYDLMSSFKLRLTDSLIKKGNSNLLKMYAYILNDASYGITKPCTIRNHEYK